MKYFQLDHVDTLQFKLPLAQQLAELRFRQGVFYAQTPPSPDWLAAQALKAQQQAAVSLNNNNPGNDSFQYPAARRYAKNLQTKTLSAAKIQALHQALHPQGGHWRQLKLSLKAQHQASLNITVGNQASSVEQEIQQAIQRLQNTLHIDPLVSLPLLVYELLICFPFLNGNRRIVLLLLTPLLIEQGHTVFNYVDIETEIIKHSQAFYQLLYQCSFEQRPIQDWLSFWWQRFQAVYDRFDRLQINGAIKAGRGSKTRLIEQDILKRQDPFSLTELCQSYPTISRDMIRAILRNCRNEGWLISTGRGRNAQWLITAKPSISPY